MRPILFALLCSPLLTFAHGHPAGLAENDPLASDVRLCNEIVDTALNALTSRDKDRPMHIHAGNDFLSRLKNEVTQHIFAEPQIRSQKFAMSYARGRCNEALHAERMR